MVLPSGDNAGYLIHSGFSCAKAVTDKAIRNKSVKSFFILEDFNVAKTLEKPDRYKVKLFWDSSGQDDRGCPGNQVDMAPVVSDDVGFAHHLGGVDQSVEFEGGA